MKSLVLVFKKRGSTSNRNKILLFLFPTLAIIGICCYSIRNKAPRIGSVIKQLQGKDYSREFLAGGHRITFQYIPATLSLLNNSDLNRSSPFTKAITDSLKSSKIGSGGLLFTMTLSPEVDSLLPMDFRNDVVYGAISGASDYKKALEKYSFGLKESIWLESDGVRYNLANYQMINTWGMTKGRTFLLMFDDILDGFPDGKGELTITVDGLVPGFSRKKIRWKLPISRYDNV